MSSRVTSSVLKQALCWRASRPCQHALSSNGASCSGARRALHKALPTPLGKAPGGIPSQRIHSSARQSKASSATGAVPLVGESCAKTTPKPNSQQLKTLFIASAVPMMGFGFMDNFIMIQAGGYIDATLGVTMGLATLTAAAMGQVVSDVSGVLFGGTVERFLHRMKMIKTPGLTEAQRHLPICRNVALAGSVVGVIIGCMLGASSLLFLDLDAHERAKRAAALHDVVTSMLSDDDSGMSCDSCTVYLGSAETDIAPSAMEKGTQIQLLKTVDGNSLAAKCANTRSIVRESFSNESLLYVPVVKGGDLVAVLEFRRARISGEAFSEKDQHTATLMARHMAIFMDRLGPD